MLKRELETTIISKLFSGKSILLVGARQVGKTTLLKQIAKSLQKEIIWLNGDNPEDRTLLNQMNGTRAKAMFPNGSIIFIDEAQRLENTGITLKVIHDNCEEIQLLATGSSSFELTDKIKESLTGRKWTFKLFPLSFSELLYSSNIPELNRALETRILFGSYPEVINSPGNEKEVLNELISDFLYKDIFALKDVRKPDALDKLTKALAFQIGNQVSNRELSQIVGIDKETIDKYIYLLEEAYIIFRLGSYSKNLRNELKFSQKIYFIDTGLRNALINRFSPLSLREDTGSLWENYLISERRKKIEYDRLYCNTYFWRTTRQQEIDYIEEYDEKISAFEFKWNITRKSSVPKTFQKAYPNADFQVITPENYFEFLK
ncbi:MAG: ATP-binding protein [Mariniphaga sp.]|nr:ATP-binding protein [Mariniphaga sp.]